MAGNHVQLSRRLKAIADMVTEGNRLVDVGCDHGYLPVYLMLNHKIPGDRDRCRKDDWAQGTGTYCRVWDEQIHRGETL